MRYLQKSEHNSKVDYDERLVTIGGAIVRACQDSKLTVWEKRLLCLAISKIDSRAGAPFDPDDITVTLDDFSDLSITRAEANKILRVASKQLYDRSIFFLEKDRNGDYIEHDVRWLQERAIKDQDYVKLVFSTRVIKYLTSITGDFSSYKLRYMMMLDSMYSVRLFEIISQWLVQGRIEIKFDELMFALSVPVKSIERGLYMRHINPAVDEINQKLNMGLSFKTKKKYNSKAIESFVFTFKNKETFLSEAPKAPSELKKKYSDFELDEMAKKRFEIMSKNGKDIEGIAKQISVKTQAKQVMGIN